MRSSWSFLVGCFWQGNWRRVGYLGHHSLLLRPRVLRREDVELLLLNAIVDWDVSCCGDDLSVGKTSIGVGSGGSNVALITRRVCDVPVSHRNPTLGGVVDVTWWNVEGGSCSRRSLRRPSLSSG